MTLFELVKIAVDELYAEAEAEHGTKVDDLIKKRITYLADSYKALTEADRKPVDYSKATTRFAYVYKYVPAHGDFMFQVLNRLNSHLGGAIFGAETLRVSCIGGGPGSEFLGLLKYLSDQSGVEPVKKVVCYLLDSEQAWADAWTEIDAGLTGDLHVNVNFQRVDATDAESFSAQKKFLAADVFLMSFFVSEIFSLDAEGGVTKFWSKIFDGAKSGALFVYVDNNSSQFSDYMDEIAKNAKLKSVMNVTAYLKPSYDEQSKELAEYKERFDHASRLTGNVAIKVFRKK